MISLISFNTSFINAESNKTIINFVDEYGNSLDIEDTVTIVKLEDQGGVKVPVSAYIKDGEVTTDYDNGIPLNELEIKDGKLEIEGLTKDDEYLISFDNDYVFQKEENDETDYFLFGSFKGGSESYISSSNLKATSELSLDKLEELSGTDDILTLDDGYLSITVSCEYIKSYNVVNNSGSNQTCNSNGCVRQGSSQGALSYTILTVDLRNNSHTTGSQSWTRSGSRSYSCSDLNVPTNFECISGSSTYVCRTGASATQYYDANGGSCDKSSDTRTKAAGY